MNLFGHWNTFHALYSPFVFHWVMERVERLECLPIWGGDRAQALFLKGVQSDRDSAARAYRKYARPPARAWLALARASALRRFKVNREAIEL
jgi:hypothetical protein